LKKLETQRGRNATSKQVEVEVKVAPHKNTEDHKGCTTDDTDLHRFFNDQKMIEFLDSELMTHI
jgi:hypothetical protein